VLWLELRAALDLPEEDEVEGYDEDVAEMAEKRQRVQK